MEKVRLTAVNYLNTKPFIYGLFQSGLDKQIEIHKDIPSKCAEKLIQNEVDIALMPVAELKNLDQHYIVSDYCIGCDGTVETVCLYSNSPIQEAKRIYLDSHSRTSVALTKILMREHWSTEVEYLPVGDAASIVLEGSAALLAIGDKSIGLEKKYQYTYDLGEAWKALTGLPFVFAAWVSNKKLDPEFIEAFNQALALGLDHIDDLVFILPEPVQDFDLKEYFENNISYELDDAKKKALRLFFSKIDQTTSPEDALQPIFA